MQCQTYDMGRRCLQPATLASPHCVHHTRSISPSATIGATGVPTPGAGTQPVQPVQQRDFQIEAENASIPLTEDMRFEAAMLDVPSILGCVEPCEKCLSRICHADTRGGPSCRFAARSGRPWCVVHDPTAAAQRSANAANAGRASGISRRSTSQARIDLNDVNIHLTTRGEIQATLDLVIRLELLGRISPVRSRNILRALAIAARNFDRPARAATRTTHGASQQDQDFDRHNDTYQPPWIGDGATFDEILGEASENDAPAAPEPPPAAGTASNPFIPSDSLMRALAALARQNRQNRP